MRRELVAMLKRAGPVVLAEIGWMCMGDRRHDHGGAGPASIGAGMSASLLFAVAVSGMGLM
jgi:hypothetical protein